MPYSNQYATTTPKIFSVNSIDTNAPREEWLAVSVAQTGVIAFRIPVPTPLNTRAQNIQLAFCAEHCRHAPMIAQSAPKPMVEVRPK